MSQLDALLVAQGGHFVWADALRVGPPAIAVTTVCHEVAAIQHAMVVGVRAGVPTISAAMRMMVKAELAPRAEKFVPGQRSTQAVDAAFARAFAAYGRTPGIQRARRAFALADARHESVAESLAAYDLDLLRYSVTPQWPLTVDGQECRSDFRVDGTNVLIEVDGMGKYADPDALRAEKRREQALRHAGYEIVRLTWEDLGNRAKIRALVEAAKARCAGRPLLP